MKSIQMAIGHTSMGTSLLPSVLNKTSSNLSYGCHRMFYGPNS